MTRPFIAGDPLDLAILAAAADERLGRRIARIGRREQEARHKGDRS